MGFLLFRWIALFTYGLVFVFFFGCAPRMNNTLVEYVRARPLYGLGLTELNSCCIYVCLSDQRNSSKQLFHPAIWDEITPTIIRSLGIVWLEFNFNWNSWQKRESHCCLKCVTWVNLFQRNSNLLWAFYQFFMLSSGGGRKKIIGRYVLVLRHWKSPRGRIRTEEYWQCIIIYLGLWACQKYCHNLVYRCFRVFLFIEIVQVFHW